ncbi:MAG: hypothetical protein MJZ02_08650 [Paludibacteraceae bacterium]|nr:hypothetical protein [Paludibacteraceae bacterium]
MFRGTTTFRCDKCGDIFRAPDIEYNCTSLSVPQKCPKCGSFHTLPLTQILFKRSYKMVWEDIDRN